jgi:hypothetical protein
VDNDEAGVKALSKELVRWSPKVIVLEAIGGHGTLRLMASQRLDCLLR